LWKLQLIAVLVFSTSDANFSAVGPLLLSAMQKVVNETKNVSVFVFFTILWCRLIKKTYFAVLLKLFILVPIVIWGLLLTSTWRTAECRENKAWRALSSTCTI